MIDRNRKRSRKIYGVTRVSIGREIVCPVCLSITDKFDRHHVIAFSANGHGFKQNVLSVCRTCHAVSSSGSQYQAWLIRVACSRYMTAVYGLAYCIQSPHVALAVRDFICKTHCSAREAWSFFDEMLKSEGKRLYAEIIGVCVRRDEDEAKNYLGEARDA